MGLFDIFNKEKREENRQKNQQLEEGIKEFVVIKEIQELMAKGKSLLQLGRNEEANNKFNKALNIVKHSIEKNPHSLEFKKLMCSIYLEVGAYDVAEEYFKLIIEEHSNNLNVDLTEIYTRLGVIKWYHRKDIPTAIKYLHEALKRAKQQTSKGDSNPEIHSEPHLYLGQIYYEKGDKQSAKAHCLERLKFVKDCQMALMLYNQIKNA